MPLVAYLECKTGIAGDMCLGALIHAGVPVDYLAEQLNRLEMADEFKLRVEPLQHNGQQATKVYVDLLHSQEPVREEGIDPHNTFVHDHSHPHDRSHSDDHGHPHDRNHNHDRNHHHTRHLPEIEHLIIKAGLPQRVESWSIAIFRRLAEAEGAVHGISPEAVHFHEVGATDAIVDIVGTCLGLDWLGIDRLYCSPMPTGGGTIRAAHGLLPVPTPAVLKLWEMRQVPIYSNGIEKELVTPTGAAIATTLAAEFGPPPALTLHRVGLGAGGRRLPLPNILRLWIGESAAVNSVPAAPVAPVATHHHSHSGHDSAAIAPAEQVTVLETQIDDLSPQAIGYTFDALFAAGALDVFTQSVGMKKSRLGLLLTVICREEQAEECEHVLFRETTTLGIRRSTQSRTTLRREFESVETRYGTVKLKIARWPSTDAIANVQPEYEDCAELARTHQVPWKEVHREALQRWYQARSTD